MTNPFRTDPFRILFRLAGLYSILFGVYIWNWHNFNRPGSAFALYTDDSRLFITLLLLVGGAIQFVGCWLYSRRAAVLGAVLCLTVFLSAEFSCIMCLPQGSGQAAYGWICGIYIAFILLTPHVPLPCSKDT